MGLTSYKNPPNITMSGAIAQNPTLQAVPRGQVFNPTGASSQVVPFQRPIQAPSPANNIAPFQRPIQAPPPAPTVQFPQQPLRAPNIPSPRTNPLQGLGQAAANQIGKNPLNQTIQGLRQGQSVGRAVAQGARQTLVGKLAAKLAAAKGKLAAAGRVAAPAAGTLGRVASATNKAALVATAAQTGWEIGKFLEPIVVEGLQGAESNAAEAASIEALAEAIAKLEAAREATTQLPPTQQPIGDPLTGFPPFVPTEPWSPTVPAPPVELPPLDPGQDIGIDLGPILRPGPIETPVVPVDPIQGPDLNTGKGGVNLNTPIWQKINQIEQKLDNLQFPPVDLTPLLDKLDLIIVAIPAIMDGITTSIEAPPNIEIPQPDLTPILTAIQTGITVVPPATITAISALIAPVIQGLTAISAQIAGQKLSTAVLLPQATNLAVAIPQTYQMATMIPQALQQAIAIPQATALAVAVPQATNLAVALPQMQTVALNDTANSTKLDIINQLSLDQITQLKTQLEALTEQTDRVKNLRKKVEECCETLEKKIKEGNDVAKNIKNKIEVEFEKNEERFPQIKREGTVKCKEEEDGTDYEFGGYTLSAIQGHLDLMLELQKLLVYKLCNFEIGGEITGQLDLTCEGDEQPTVLPFTGKGIEGLALQSAVMMEGLKKIWSKVCGDTEIVGEIPLLCPAENASFPEFTPYQGRGIQGLSAQLSALALLNQKVLQESCKKNEPIVIKAHYETHLEEFKVTKSLELTFGEDYPTQKGSLTQLTIPYPKGEFIGEGELCSYSLWEWEDFEIERLHGSAYCRLNLANSNRYMAIFAADAEWGRNFLRELYAKFVDSAIAPPSHLDGDGLPLVRVSPGLKPRRNPVQRTTRCVKAVVTDFDNNEPIKYAVWFPPRSQQTP